MILENEVLPSLKPTIFASENGWLEDDRRSFSISGWLFLAGAMLVSWRVNFNPNRNLSSWRFQPILNIFVKLDPQVGVKIKTYLKPPPTYPSVH